MDDLMPNRNVEKEESKDMHFTFFGHDRFSAAKNMAIDEALKQSAEKDGAFFVRFYDFTAPAIILSVSDSLKCVKEQAFSEGIEISRRKSSGKPIYVDDNAIAYSVIGPVNPPHNLNFSSLNFVHNYFGGRIAEAIGDVTNIDAGRIKTEEVYSIRVDGEPIAGNAQYPTLGMSFLYHGVLAVGNWDPDRINSLIRLRENDYGRLRDLPSILRISGHGVSAEEAKSRIVKGMLERITGGEYSEIRSEEKEVILERADVLVRETYNTKAWIERSDAANLKEDSTFCLLYPD